MAAPKEELDSDTAFELLHEPHDKMDPFAPVRQPSWMCPNIPISSSRDWNLPFHSPFGPLMRIWDVKSGSKPDKLGGAMKARAHRQPLRTREERKAALTIHADHKSWTDTPFISFMMEPGDLQNLAEKRANKGYRGKQSLIVINPNTRFRKDLPFIKMLDAMDHYGLDDPYKKEYQFYNSEYLCLWEVTPDEVVGQWKWNDLMAARGSEDWYEKIIRPVFEKHVEEHRQPIPDTLKSPMHTPETSNKQASPTSRPDKGPFLSCESWNAKIASVTEICFPTLSGTKRSIAKDFTRSTKARYRKSPITFKRDGFEYDTLEFDEVQIPFDTGEGYGSDFIYLGLPIWAREAFAEAGRKHLLTQVDEKSLMPSEEYWWKIARKFEGKFGIIDRGTGEFSKENLGDMFESKGLTCSMVLKFFHKASVDETGMVSATAKRTVLVEVVRGCIEDDNVDVQLPVRVPTKRNRIIDLGLPTDAKLTPDSVVERFSLLDIGVNGRDPAVTEE